MSGSVYVETTGYHRVTCFLPFQEALQRLAWLAVGVLSYGHFDARSELGRLDSSPADVHDVQDELPSYNRCG